VLGEELADGLGKLGSFAGPVIDAIALEVDGCGLGAGVVGTDHFDGTAIAGAIFFDDNDAVVGLLTGANARQTNHQHWGKSSQKSLNVFRVADGVLVALCGVALEVAIDTADGRKSPNN
jgi:hypothetical protein